MFRKSLLVLIATALLTLASGEIATAQLFKFRHSRGIISNCNCQPCVTCNTPSTPEVVYCTPIASSNVSATLPVPVTANCQPPNYWKDCGSGRRCVPSGSTCCNRGICQPPRTSCLCCGSGKPQCVLPGSFCCGGKTCPPNTTCRCGDYGVYYCKPKS